MTKAVLATAVGAPAVLSDVDLPEPGPGEVAVAMAAAGVCHSDASLLSGLLAQPMPAVLGHEGSGTVTAVGPDVEGVAAGDRVVLNWSTSCGRCAFCSRGETWLCQHAMEPAARVYGRAADGTDVHPGLGVAAFGEHTVVPARAVLPVPTDIPLEPAALAGCAVLTAYGAVHTVARVRPGDSVAVFGLGGVGLAIILAARAAGAGPIIGVDTSDRSAELARRCGATDVLVDPSGETVPKQVRQLTGGTGVDCAFEAVGRADVMRRAWTVTRRGGHTVVVGIGRREDTFAINALELPLTAKTLSGCYYGNSDPARTLPLVWEDMRRGLLDLDLLVGSRIGLPDVPDALQALLDGTGRGRTLVTF